MKVMLLILEIEHKARRERGRWIRRRWGRLMEEDEREEEEVQRKLEDEMCRREWEVSGKEQRMKEKKYAKNEKDKELEKKRKEVGYKRRWWRRGKDEHKMSGIITDSMGSCWLQAKQRDYKMSHKCGSTILPTL